jgi:hypothetical protein
MKTRIRGLLEKADLPKPRRARKARKAKKKATRGFSFDEICEAMHLILSPQSCLDPRFWQRFILPQGSAVLPCNLSR